MVLERARVVMNKGGVLRLEAAAGSAFVARGGAVGSAAAASECLDQLGLPVL